MKLKTLYSFDFRVEKPHPSTRFPSGTLAGRGAAFRYEDQVKYTQIPKISSPGQTWIALWPGLLATVPGVTSQTLGSSKVFWLLAEEVESCLDNDDTQTSILVLVPG